MARKKKGKSPHVKSTQMKSKRPSSSQISKKKRTYSEKELGISPLNTVVPAGVGKPRGKKKGKIFVDDPVSILKRRRLQVVSRLMVFAQRSL